MTGRATDTTSRATDALTRVTGTIACVTGTTSRVTDAITRVTGTIACVTTMTTHATGTIDRATRMTKRRRQRGFALLIVLWTVGFLALLGTQIVAAGRSDTQLADNLKQQAVLQAATDGAIANVMFTLVGARNPSLQPDGVVREIRIGQVPVLVRIVNESDRINLNTASGALIRALIVDVGGPPGVAAQVAAAILDWRTEGTTARQGGAKAPQYQAAGRSYGPPEAPFQSVGELTDVLGMTPALFARMAPHITVLTDGDPDMSTRDPVVAQALTDAAGVADVTEGEVQTADQMFRIFLTAVGPGGARYSTVVVASADFQNASPRVNVVLQEDGAPMTNSATNGKGGK
jgi:general secretion pathway protein K